MANWECYKLLYELKTPIHIGSGKKYGIIDRTRYYVPGKTMWGATVAEIGNQKELKENKKWGSLKKSLCSPLKFTYFYIFDKNEENEPQIPKYGENGLKFGLKGDNKSRSEFEKDYIGSFVSTGVEKETGSASEGDLYEIEVIEDRRNRCNERLCILGYVFINVDEFEELNGLEEENFIDWVNELQIGGERKYGYGEIELDKKERIDLENETENKTIFNNWEIHNLSSNNPIIKSKDSDNEGNNIFGHLLLDESTLKDIDSIRGDLEPLIGRVYDGSEGQKAECTGIGLSPGSKTKMNKLEISKYGTLKPLTEN
ncbi:MAG: CRISPR associated protein, RAMP family Cas5 group [Candidatus Methanohalarchaeum thermophilum]|uniref:CRISPR associated protein, RAMP family Cas5 group n=1 Tax=Methanohalarchaeum thermophilum TaxID=1903181 RepID=A0A1Q6DVD6_METT1|nr:MAG: CRISPR associated protein, RAMP family Cas5 group [Candidatus Methanohalarchaeum thermophilum]